MSADRFTFLDVFDLLADAVVEVAAREELGERWVQAMTTTGWQTLLGDCVRPLFDKSAKPPTDGPAALVFATFNQMLTERAGGTYIYGARQLRKAATEARIGAALAERPALTMKAVAARAGVSRSTLYSYLDKRSGR